MPKQLEPTNPGARLINTLRPLLADARNPNSGATVGKVFAGYFQLSFPADLGEVLRKSALLTIVVSEYRTAMETVTGVDPRPFLSRFENIERSFANFNLFAGTKDVFGPIDEVTMNQLEMGEALLRQFLSEPALTKADAAEISRLLDDLDVASLVGLSDSASTFLIEHVRVMRRALQDAKLVGVGPVREAAYRTVGEIVVRGDLRDEMKHGGEDVSKFWKVIAQVLILTQVVQTALDVPLKLAELAAPTEATSELTNEGDLGPDAGP